MSENTPVILKTTDGSVTMYGVMAGQHVRVRLTAKEAEECMTHQLTISDHFWTVARLTRIGWNILPLTRID